jgi:ankyrin repeat protein
LLIFFGFAINAKDALGRSPLWHAIKRWNKEMVDLLLEHDASVDKSIHDLAFQQALTFSDPREIAEMIHAKFQQTTLSHEPEPNSPKRRCILS